MSHDFKTILNIGAGKIDLDEESECDFNVYLDRSYEAFTEPYDTVRDCISSMTGYCEARGRGNVVLGETLKHYIACDIFEFLDSFPFRFDVVVAHRIFEHMEFCSGEIGRLLEAINMITVDGATVDIIVPNHNHYAEKLIALETQGNTWSHVDFANELLLINSEFCNIKADPHASIWTPMLAKYYIEQEGTWIIQQIIENVEFACRDYMKICLLKNSPPQPEEEEV